MTGRVGAIFFYVTLPIPSIIHYGTSLSKVMWSYFVLTKSTSDLFWMINIISVKLERKED